ncbi:MAG: rod shape-determining protein MreD [Eggerthellaceae bacterium]|jgi:rod shape-determining protein MreD|nr:rod shape-determining protein MreD [Eggerthellaceae bacterium]MCH4220331.1 rod shape-determining protein MreD [Eggerthellaceae bacterium]
MQRETVILTIGAIIAVLLQVILAPNIEIVQAIPNFLIVYVLVSAMLFQGNGVYIVAFVLGLMGDLIGFGPVGALAFLLVLGAFCAQHGFNVFNNGTVFVPLILIMGLSLIIELLYAAFALATGLAASPLEAFLTRALPCTLYDCVVGLILYPILSHIMLSNQTTMGSSTPRARLR